MKTIDKILKESNDKIGKMHYIGYCALFVIMLVYSCALLFGAGSNESVAGDAVIASPFVIIAFTGPAALCYVLAEKNLAKRNKMYLLLELIIGLLGIPVMYAFFEGASAAFVIYAIAAGVLSGIVAYDLLKKK